jgi:hypothetical protein
VNNVTSDQVSGTISIQVATPEISPTDAAISSTQPITLTSATPAAVIYYTTNGSTPTTSSTLYTAPFTIGSDATIKALAVKAGCIDSGIASRSYLVIDGDVAAFLNATGITDPTIISALTTYVAGLKSAGIWTKTVALYPFVGGTADTNKYNLKDPRDLDAAYRLSFQGGWSHSSLGSTPNGTTGYAEMFINTALYNTNDGWSYAAQLMTNKITASYSVVMGRFVASSNFCLTIIHCQAGR